MGKPFPGPWTFRYHPWLIKFLDTSSEFTIAQKSAQMGFTEALLNWTFYQIDVNAESVMYVLPTDDNAKDFSASRFDPALESSQYLSNLFSDVKNVQLKRAGNATLYVRGSRSKNKLISVPVGKIALDEYDRMVMENIPMLWERASGQISKQFKIISTPTIPGIGINQQWDQSTKSVFFFRNPCCGKFVTLQLENFKCTADDINDPRILESFIECPNCKKPLPTTTEAKADIYSDWEWVPEFPNREVEGQGINQLFSCTVNPKEFATGLLKSKIDPASEQEFFNQKMGMPHVVAGGRVVDEDIDAAKGQFSLHDKFRTDGYVVTMGVDVGSKLHVEVDQWFINRNATDPHLAMIPHVRCFTCDEFGELDQFIFNYGVQACVIDANPESRLARQFADRFPGIVRVCYYGSHVRGREIVVDDHYPVVTVARNSWLDMSQNRFIAKGIKGDNRRIVLPRDIPLDYQVHIKNLVKQYSRDKDGNPVMEWTSGNRPDHFAHARNYSEIALSMAVATSGSSNIKV